jgi:dihydrofolate reductase
MGRTVNSTYITLDGVVENPQLWPSTGEDGGESFDIQNDLVQGCEAMLMGRRTYESFASVWPTRSGDPVSDKFNSMPKYVVSTTLGTPEWNNTTVISRNPLPEIERLKQESHGDIVQYGFGQLTETMMEHDLLDELRLWIHPFFLGGAEPNDLIYRHCPAARFNLADSKILRNGMVILTYAVANAPREV